MDTKHTEIAETIANLQLLEQRQSITKLISRTCI